MLKTILPYILKEPTTLLSPYCMQDHILSKQRITPVTGQHATPERDNHVVGLCSVRWALSVGANLLKRDTHPWKMSYACSDTALYWAASSLNLLGSSFDLWSLLTTRCGVLPVSSEIAECVLQIVIEFIKPSVTRWSINESRYCILKTLNMDKR